MEDESKLCLHVVYLSNEDVMLELNIGARSCRSDYGAVLSIIYFDMATVPHKISGQIWNCSSITVHFNHAHFIVYIWPCITSCMLIF